MESNKLYPSLNDINNPSMNKREINKKDLENMIDNKAEDKIQKIRSEIIINKCKELEKQTLHYNKLRSRWNKISSTLRISGVIIGGTLTISAAIISSLSIVSIPIVIPITVGIIGSIQTTSSELLAFTYVKRKIKEYDNKLEKLNKFINRLWLFYHKSSNDKNITLDELDQFYKIIDEVESNKHNKVEDIKDSFNMDLIRSEAIKQAESESRIELINKLKEEKKKKLKINTI